MIIHYVNIISLKVMLIYLFNRASCFLCVVEHDSGYIIEFFYLDFMSNPINVAVN